MRRLKTASALATFIPGLIVLLLLEARIQGAQIPHIEITPYPAFIGERVKIVLGGFSGNQPVTVRVCATNSLFQRWESQAEFLTDRSSYDV